MAVVGGGMAGVSVAYELAATHSVIVLEQEDQLARHATGRSAAMFLASYGSPPVRALTRASRLLLDAATASGGVPLLTPRALLWVSDPGRERAVAAMVADRPGLQGLTASEALRLCPVLRADRVGAAAVEPDAQDIDVAGLHQWYLREARRAGVSVLTGSPVTAVVREGGRWRLRHRHGEVAAAVVVDAAGAWADRVAALFGAQPQSLEPRRRTIAIGRPQRSLPQASAMVADVDDAFYFRPEGPNVLVSPADETPSEPCDARPEEADVALAIERVNQITTLGIRSVVTTWAGLRTFAPDRNPVVGDDPEVPGLFWLAGQGGTGIQMAPALAGAAAAWIRDGRVAARDVVPDLDLDAVSPARR